MAPSKKTKPEKNTTVAITTDDSVNEAERFADVQRVPSVSETLDNDSENDSRPLKKKRCEQTNLDQANEANENCRKNVKTEERSDSQEKKPGKDKSVPVIDRQLGTTFAAVINPSKASNTDVRGSAEHSSIEPTEQKDQGALVHKTPLVSNTVYLEDHDTFVVPNLPDHCEVMDEDAQDEVLRDGYANLPPLRQGSFRSWDAVSGPGHPMFSQFWAAVVPDMRIWNCVDAIQFTQSGRFVNPSRADPMLVNVKRHTPDGSNHRLFVNATFAVCVTAIAVTDSYIMRPPTTGLRQRQLRGLVHSQEWDRLVAFFCMVFNQPVLTAQLYKDALSFVTKSGGGGGSKRQVESSLFRPSKRTHHPSGRQQQSRTEPFFLDADDDVPVFDGRAVDFNLQETISTFKTKLPKFLGEIPKQSFAVVGYTAASYQAVKDSRWNFSANLQWVIVLGTPKEHEFV